MNVFKNIQHLIFLCIIFVCIFKQAKLDCTKSSTLPIKTYIIDLDKPPRERFTESAKDFKDDIASYIKINKEGFKIPENIIKLAELFAADIDSFFPYPFNEELKGIAEAADINLGDIVISNLIYDLTAFCTSIIATKQNGQIIHGRNLDYGYSSYLKNATYLAKFVRNGEVLFTSAQLAGKFIFDHRRSYNFDQKIFKIIKTKQGYIGILTGHKHNNFTFSINERDQGNLWDNLIAALFDRNVKPLSFLTREVLENSTSFNDAVNKLSKENIVAPAYFILGGVETNEGVVITRNQTHLIDLWSLDSKSTGIEKWYLLETNYDHWVPPPPNDDRRTPGMRAMNQTTQANINEDTLLDVLTISPVCNRDTVYSVTMSAIEEDSLKITIR